MRFKGSTANSKKSLRAASFFMAYPFFAIIQNLSFYFILFYFYTSRSLNLQLFKLKGTMSWFTLLYFTGVIISVISAGLNMDHEHFEGSVAVLPNYLYWGVLIITLGNTAFKYCTLIDYYKMFFYGVIAAVITYYLLNPFLIALPFYRNVTPNNFAFILIIFSPMATAYVKHKTNNTFYAIVFMLCITVAGFLSGSRAGSLLTFIGCGLILVIGNWTRILLIAFMSLFMYLIAPQILEAPFIKNTIFTLNERTYNILYETTETLQTDRSYLTRLAMIEKGLSIFEDNPLTGVGLGNFSKTSANIDYDFEGSEFISNKNSDLETSTNPHNSYISFLSEGGLLLIIPLLLLLLYPVFYFSSHFNVLSELEKALFISIILMIIDAWFITGLVNVYAWFILGIANGFIILKTKSANKLKTAHYI
jgi:O-antigen ligase